MTDCLPCAVIPSIDREGYCRVTNGRTVEWRIRLDNDDDRLLMSDG